jgi:glutathione S-transferase
MTIRLHEYAPSGNCYKLRLLMRFLELPFERIGYDILKGETRTPEFLARVNANGRIPVLEIDGQFLPESNAALYYLAQNTAYWPVDRFAQAQALQWMFFEQYNVEPNLATARFWVRYVGVDALSDLQRQQLPHKLEAGRAALKVLDQHLSARLWVVGDSLSIADIALYGYVHCAPDVGVDLNDYPAVAAWGGRFAALPAYLPISA